MKHADKVIDLLAAYPSRPFCMRQIVRYVNPRAGLQERSAIKKAVQRVLAELLQLDNVMITPPAVAGGKAFYTWKSGT